MLKHRQATDLLTLFGRGLHLNTEESSEPPWDLSSNGAGPG